MGLPVIAGDHDVAALYQRHVGMVPYTFAGNEDALEVVIKRLVDDPAFYEAEAARVCGYVVEYHDYPAVARRYEQILATAMGREDILTTTNPVVQQGSRPATAAGEAGGSTAPVNKSTRKRGKAAA